MAVAEVRTRHHEAVAELPAGALLIGAEWMATSSGGEAGHVDPSTGEVQASFPMAGPAEIDAAVHAARAALPAWRGWDAARRRDVLLRIAALLRSNAAQFAVIASLENGQPIRSSNGVAAKAADWFEYYAGWADKLEGSVHEVYPGSALDYDLLEPYGVVAALPSWNGPVTGIGRKVAPALAAGNCVVLKPSELAPFSTFLFGRLCLEAGLPPGVLAVVPGDAAAGDHLVRHPGVDKITMTGSPATARAIMAAAAQRLTPLTFELGGKSANLVFADADANAVAAFAATQGTVRNAGQGCVLPTRLLVQRPIYARVIDQVAQHLGAVAIGDPLDESMEMGPVISSAACARILSVVRRAVDEGHGTLVSGGDRLAGPLAEGFFLSPALFADVDNRSSLAQNEVFGPVLAAMPFDDEEEGLALANDTPYALAGYVHTKDVNRAHRAAARLDAGYVSVNGFNPMAPTAPFGGSRDSGFGREGGREGILEFVRPKNVYVALQGS